MEKKIKGRVNLLKGKGVVSVSVDDCIQSYHAEYIRTRRHLKPKRYEVYYTVNRRDFRNMAITPAHSSLGSNGSSVSNL